MICDYCHHLHGRQPKRDAVLYTLLHLYLSQQQRKIVIWDPLSSKCYHSNAWHLLLLMYLFLEDTKNKATEDPSYPIIKMNSASRIIQVSVVLAKYKPFSFRATLISALSSMTSCVSRHDFFHTLIHRGLNSQTLVHCLEAECRILACWQRLVGLNHLLNKSIVKCWKRCDKLEDSPVSCTVSKYMGPCCLPKLWSDVARPADWLTDPKKDSAYNPNISKVHQ